MTADTLRAPLLPTAVAAPEPPLLASRSLWGSPRRSTPPAAFAQPPARPDSFAAATAAGPVMCAFHFHAGEVTSLHAQVALDFVRAGGASDAGWTWVHLRRDHPGAEAWLQQVLSVDEASREALLSTDSRPRCMPGLGRSVLLRLRGLHRRYRPAGERDAPPAAPLPADEECPPEPARGGANGSANGGAASSSSPAAGAQHTAGALEEYNDLYAITLLIQPDKVVSSAEVSLEAVRHARELLHEHRPSTPRSAGGGGGTPGTAPVPATASVFSHGYRTPGAFVAQMVEFLIDDATQVVAQLQDDLDAFEEASGAAAAAASGGSGAGGGDAPAAAGGAYSDDAAIAALSEHRRLAVKLRRWVGPQREALKDLVLKGSLWLYADDDAARHKLRLAMDSTAQLAESLDAIREHALVLKDELSALQQSRANHALYVLSMVSALFLPFSFVTGLLSMSVGGIPGQRDERAFYVVALGCVVLLLLGCVLFRRLRWL